MQQQVREIYNEAQYQKAERIRRESERTWAEIDQRAKSVMRPYPYCLPHCRVTLDGVVPQ
jgi:hypothetical protein